MIVARCRAGFQNASLPTPLSACRPTYGAPTVGLNQPQPRRAMAERATRQLHLNLFIHGRGHHEAAWRHPTSSTLPLTDIRYYTDLARKAEAGLFDSVFLADTLAVGDDVARAPRTWLEAIITLAALAGG